MCESLSLLGEMCRVVAGVRSPQGCCCQQRCGDAQRLVGHLSIHGEVTRTVIEAWKGVCACVLWGLCVLAVGNTLGCEDTDTVSV